MFNVVDFYIWGSVIDVVELTIQHAIRSQPSIIIIYMIDFCVHWMHFHQFRRLSFASTLFYVLFAFQNGAGFESNVYRFRYESKKLKLFIGIATNWTVQSKSFCFSLYIDYDVGMANLRCMCLQILLLGTLFNTTNCSLFLLLECDQQT